MGSIICVVRYTAHSRMNLLSLNVGLPREVTWRGDTTLTGIYKDPVQGRVALKRLNLDGDRQADLTVHGGAHKAVYCYPVEHYAYWKGDLPMGAFGENFTTDGMLEDAVQIGDRFAVGTAEVVVTQPRLPCYKLGIRFQDDHMVKRFFASRRTGFYVAVAKEGEVGAGDRLEPIGRDPNGVAVSEFLRLYAEKRYREADEAVIQKMLRVAALPESWKEYFLGRLDRAQ
jgi:MOSC domain-containing protein YiiM